MRFLALAPFLAASPAHAAVILPEPSSMALFGMGVAGVVIGRYLSRNRDTKD